MSVQVCVDPPRISRREGRMHDGKMGQEWDMGLDVFLALA